MAEENTTDSTPTSETVNPAPEDTSTSTTTPQPKADDEAPPTTLLTGDDEEAAEPKADEAKPNAFIGAPEGDYELTGLPEGTVVDEQAMQAIVPIAKEIGLSNEGLSKIASVYAEKVLPGVVDKMTDDLQRNIAAQHAAWGSESIEMIKTDPAFEGKQINEIKQVAAKTLDRFGGAEFRSFLDDTGLGNHPAMVKMAYLVGSAISEDTTFERGGPAPAPKSSTEKFYGPQS